MNKYKKSISLLLIIAMVSSTIILSSTKTVDERLEAASDITRKILNVDIQEDEDKCGYVSSYYVKGLL